MDFQKIKSYKDLEILLKESCAEDIRAKFKTIETFTSALNEKLRQTIDEWNFDLEDSEFFEGDFEQKFSEFNCLLPVFQEELDSMVECAKLTWSKDVLEPLSDETIKDMIDCHLKLREHSLQQLDAIYNMLRLFAHPHEVIDEYKELEKQNPRPVSSNNSGCMVRFLVILASIAVTIL